MTAAAWGGVGGSPEALMRATGAALREGDALLAESAHALPALVAQLEQAIGHGAVPREVAPLVGQARRLAARIAASREQSRAVLRRWAS